MSDYINYPLGTRIRLKKDGKEGDAFESALGFISVFLDDMDGEQSLFRLNEVEILNEGICSEAESNGA